MWLSSAEQAICLPGSLIRLVGKKYETMAFFRGGEGWIPFNRSVTFISYSDSKTFCSEDWPDVRLCPPPPLAAGTESVVFRTIVSGLLLNFWRF